MTYGSLIKTWSPISFGDVLAKNNNLGPGFGFIRVALAIAILYSHSFGIASGAGGIFDIVHHVNDAGTTAGATPLSSGTVWDTLRHLRLLLVLNHTDAHFTDTLVPAFFALSGFLVTGSAFRTKAVRPFLVFRILRILPALFTEVTLSALVLGPLLTSFSLIDYFSDPKFLAYFGNIIGHVKFQLPGLFLDNPAPDIVNGNLRTLPAEFYCYLIIAFLIASGALFHRLFFTIVFVAVTLPILIFGSSIGFEESALSVPATVYYFFCGSLFFHWREKIPLNSVLLAISILLLYFHFLSRSSVLFFPLLLTYVTIYLGLSRIPTPNLISRGDYSYGIYLYGFPITQALVTIVPKLQGHGFTVFIVTTPIVFAFATFSWHVIERPALRLKTFVARPVVAKAA
jgi:peptidoglycan/LPS O-acetylase OafA/YrhL